MSLVKFRDPFDSVFPSWINYNRQDRFSDWYNGITPSLGKTNYRWNEDDKTYTLEAVMPGLTKKDISITFKSDKLTIKCDKSVSEKDKDFYGVKTERTFSNFPQAVNVNNIEAEMVDGILKVILHKKEPDGGKTVKIR